MYRLPYCSHDYVSHLKANAAPQNAHLVARIQPRSWHDFVHRQLRIEVGKVDGNDIRPVELFIATPAGISSEFGVCINCDPIVFDRSLLNLNAPTKQP